MVSKSKLSIMVDVDTLCEAAQKKYYELEIDRSKFIHLMIESNAVIMGGNCTLYLTTGKEQINAFVKTTVKEVYFLTTAGERFENFWKARKRFELAKLLLEISTEQAQAEEWMYE